MSLFVKQNPTFVKKNISLTRAYSMPKRTFREHNKLATSMINARLEKLRTERNALLNQSQSRYNLSNLMYNPYMYSYQFMEPIYMPLEVPMQGQPIVIPRIEMGGPVNEKPVSNCCCNGGGMKTTDIVLLINAMNRRQPTPPKAEPVVLPKIETKYVYVKPPPPVKKPNLILRAQECQFLSVPKERKKKKKPTPVAIFPVVTPPIEKPKIIRKPPEKIRVRKDWWRLCRDFVNLYIYFSTAKKYSNKYARLRNSGIKKMTMEIIQDISVLKDWIVSIEEPFWNEFFVFEDLNVSFKKSDPKKKIKKETQKIVAIIKKFIENLISKSSKLKDIPDRVEEVIYDFVKDGAYYPKKYLTTFQVNRLDFEFYGSTKYITDTQAGMILAFVIISGVVVQQILLHMKDVFPEFAKFKNIDISAKYIGSVMHYLTRDSFAWEPGMVKDLLSLFNYYRNYHLFYDLIESQNDIFNYDLQFLDSENTDEYAEFLVPESEISDFWELNEGFVSTFKEFVFSWSCKLAKSVKTKFSKVDPNLKEKSRMKRPKDRTVRENDGEIEDISEDNEQYNDNNAGYNKKGSITTSSIEKSSRKLSDNKSKVKSNRTINTNKVSENNEE